MPGFGSISTYRNGTPLGVWSQRSSTSSPNTSAVPFGSPVSCCRTGAAVNGRSSSSNAGGPSSGGVCEGGTTGPDRSMGPVLRTATHALPSWISTSVTSLMTFFFGLSPRFG